MAAKCRARVPEQCWRHGNQQGVEANRAIQAAVTRPKQTELAPHLIHHRPLKQMNAPRLAVALTNFADNHPVINGVKVRESVALAAELHRHDLRANRGKYDATPYIEHPLRNALRIIRWGCDDESTLIAAVLHDTVEDHPYDLARKYDSAVTFSDEAAAREAAHKYIAAQYGDSVSDIVRHMSNPIMDKYTPAEIKNKAYAEHVEHAIKDPAVCVNKLADFKDNALSLHHTTGMSEMGARKRATKYMPVVAIFENRLKQGVINKDLPIEEEKVVHILKELQEGRVRLQTFISPAETQPSL